MGGSPFAHIHQIFFLFFFATWLFCLLFVLFIFSSDSFALARIRTSPPHPRGGRVVEAQNLALHSATWASKFCRQGFGFNPSFRGSSPTPVWVPVLNGPGGPLVELRILQLTCSTESCMALPKRPKPRFRVEPEGRQHLDL